MSKRTGGIEVAKIRKKNEQGGGPALGARRRTRSGHWETGGVRGWAVYWICWLNIFITKYYTIKVLSFLSRVFNTTISATGMYFNQIINRTRLTYNNENNSKKTLISTHSPLTVRHIYIKPHIVTAHTNTRL